MKAVMKILLALLCVSIMVVLQGCGCDEAKMKKGNMCKGKTTCKDSTECVSKEGCCDAEVKVGGTTSKMKDSMKKSCEKTPGDNKCA